MNTNLWKYALPLLATAAAATVGISMQPQSYAARESAAPQTIASSTREPAARSPANECLEDTGKASHPQATGFDDLLSNCSDPQQ